VAKFSRVIIDFNPCRKIWWSSTIIKSAFLGGFEIMKRNSLFDKCSILIAFNKCGSLVYNSLHHYACYCSFLNFEPSKSKIQNNCRDRLKEANVSSNRCVLAGTKGGELYPTKGGD